MIKNIVFDLGSVLVDFNPLKYLESFNFDDNINQLLCDLIFYSREWLECDEGKYSKNTDIIEILCEKNPDYAEKIRLVLTENWVKMLTLKEDSISFLKKLKKEIFKIYILSNLSEQSYQHICKYDFFELVDGGVYSYEAKICKPELQIYEDLLQKYNLIPEETIFIDDMKENVKIAEELHIHGIVFDDLEKVKKDVKKLIRIEEAYN